MDSALQLSAGSIERMFNCEEVPNPVLQVLTFKSVKEGTKYRLFVSDGIYKSGWAMIASQLNHYITDNILDNFCIVRLDKYICNNIKDSKKVLVIFEMEILCSGAVVKSVLGNPVFLAEKGQAVQQMEVDQPASFTSKAPASNRTNMNESQAMQSNIHPIASLNPYQNKWTICARVASKTDIKRWSNAKGEGHLFSCVFLDQSGEIRATAFKDQCDKFYNLLEVNKLFYISQAQLKTANKQYSNLKNDYEMTFTAQTQVTPCHEERSNIPAMQFEFVSFENVENVEKDKIIDVIGVCKNTDDLSCITSKASGKEIKKRDIQLLDNSGREIRLTIWGSQAETFDGQLRPILALKSVKVSDFNGKSLSALSSSTLTINPDIPEAHKLRAWYENIGCNLETVNLSNQRTGGNAMGTNFKTLGEAIQENLGHNDVDYYSTKAIVSLIRKENCMYSACPSDGCNKKIIDMNNGQYRCEKCNKEYDSFNWRLMLSVSIADGTDNIWLTVFQDQAETLLSCSSAVLGNWKENNSDQFHSVFQEATFKEFVLKLRVKMETYNEESRIKTTVVSVQPLDLIEYNKKLISEIKTMVGLN